MSNMKGKLVKRKTSLKRRNPQQKMLKSMAKKPQHGVVNRTVKRIDDSSDHVKSPSSNSAKCRRGRVGALIKEVVPDDELSNENEDDVEMEQDEASSDVEDNGSDPEDNDNDEENNSDSDSECDDEENDSDSEGGDELEKRAVISVKDKNKKRLILVDNDQNTYNPKKLKVQKKMVNSSAEKLEPKSIHNNTVFVAHLPRSIKLQTLKNHFEIAGEIQYVRLFKKVKSDGYCFIKMVDDASFQKALELHNSVLDGQQIVVAGQTINKGRQNKQENLVAKNVVLVRNLPDSIVKHTLQEHFAKAGKIRNIRILVNWGTNKRYAFITMADPESCETALSFHHTMIGGQQIEVTKGSGNRKRTSRKANVKPEIRGDVMQKLVTKMCAEVCKNMLSRSHKPRFATRPRNPRN